MRRKAKKTKSLAAAADKLIHEATGKRPKPRRRGRKLLLVVLIGLGLAAVKVARDKAAAPAPSPAPPAPSPTPAAAPVEPKPDALARFDNESPAVPGVVPDEVPAATETADPLSAPVVEAEPETDAPPADATEPEPVAPAAAPATEELHDIVEEPWGDAAITPVEDPATPGSDSGSSSGSTNPDEPPADSLTSFFDEVMTDTAERKLRKEK